MNNSAGRLSLYITKEKEYDRIKRASRQWAERMGLNPDRSLSPWARAMLLSAAALEERQPR